MSLSEVKSFEQLSDFLEAEMQIRTRAEQPCVHGHARLAEASAAPSLSRGKIRRLLSHRTQPLDRSLRVADARAGGTLRFHDFRVQWDQGA